MQSRPDLAFDVSEFFSIISILSALNLSARGKPHGRDARAYTTGEAQPSINARRQQLLNSVILSDPTSLAKEWDRRTPIASTALTDLVFHVSKDSRCSIAVLRSIHSQANVELRSG